MLLHRVEVSHPACHELQPAGTILNLRLAIISHALLSSSVTESCWKVLILGLCSSTPDLLLISAHGVADEVSSHLDLVSIEALTACLQKYTGAVVLVSHDQHFVSEVADKVNA